MSNTDNIYTALVKAQTEMGKLVKGSENPHFRSKYADLASVVDACQGALNDNNLAFFHAVERNEEGLVMKTILVYAPTKESIEDHVPLIVGKNDMQGFKSACTYAKRIGLENITGLAPEDDDGNAAAKHAPKETDSRLEPARKSARQAKADGDWDVIEGAIEGAETFDQLGAAWGRIQPVLKSAPKAWIEQAEELKDKRKAELANPGVVMEAAE